MGCNCTPRRPDSVLQGRSAAPGLWSGKAHVLRIRVPSPENLCQGWQAVPDRVSARRGPGEADRHEPQDRVLEPASAHDSESGEPRGGSESRPTGLAELFYRVLSERGEPYRQTRRSPSDALGETEVQAARTQ